MRYRKLRIAWSVVWGSVAVLLIVLWVRSYWWLELPEAFTEACGHNAYLTSGQISIDVTTWTTEGSEDQPQFLVPENARVKLLPFWIPFAVSFASALLPWLPRRFSLRTLLIATTLVAVMLGLIAWAAR